MTDAIEEIDETFERLCQLAYVRLLQIKELELSQKDLLHYVAVLEAQLRIEKV